MEPPMDFHINPPMLTTVDNPFSPFDEWDSWFMFDTTAGYHSSGLIARIINASHELSDLDFTVAMTEAIDEIVRENVSGVHRKVTKETYHKLKEL